jgi:hypothetical protein
MQSQIQGELLQAKKEAKEIRVRKSLHIFIIVGLSVLFFIIPYFSPPANGLYVIDVFVVLFGGMYVLLGALPSVYQPLSKEKQAFVQIFKAIDVLNKSKEPIAYEAALKYLEKADMILDSQLTVPFKWYEKINQSLFEFRGNLKYVLLPSTQGFKIKTEHLEEIALALVRESPEEIAAINQKIRNEPSYVRVTPQPQKSLIALLKENKLTKIGYSLGLGYILIIVICLIFTLSTGQDFSNFVRANPAIVIGGGLGLSGLTFWRT